VSTLSASQTAVCPVSGSSLAARGVGPSSDASSSGDSIVAFSVIIDVYAEWSLWGFSAMPCSARATSPTASALGHAQVLLADAYVGVKKVGALMGLHVVHWCAHDFITWLRVYIDKCMGSFIWMLVRSLSGNFIPPNGYVRH
jgi:hypothetical protein